MPLKRRNLPLRTSVLTAFTLTPNKPLDRRLDLRLRGVASHVEYDLVLLGDLRRLLGDRRSADDVVEMFLAHLNRASSASTAALRQDQLLAAENVVDVDALDGQHVDIGNVARGIGEARCSPRRRRR